MIITPLLTGTFLIYLLKRLLNFIFSIIFILIISGLLTPVLNHFIVIKNTVFFFLTNTGMIGPITIQFLSIFLASFIYFVIVKSIYRMFIN